MKLLAGLNRKLGFRQVSQRCGRVSWLVDLTYDPDGALCITKIFTSFLVFLIVFSAERKHEEMGTL